MKKQLSLTFWKYGFERFLKMDSVSRKFIDGRAVEVDFGIIVPGSPSWVLSDYAELSGALAGSAISVTFFVGALRIVVVNELFSDPFVIGASFRNGVPHTLFPHRLRLKDQEQSQGVATRLFYVHARAATRLGFRLIEATALQVGEEAECRYNGAYTFGRLGFNGDLTDSVLTGLPSKFGHCKTLLQLMETEDGRNAWSKNAKSIAVMFDLNPESLSWRTLNKYLKLKKIRINS